MKFVKCLRPSLKWKSKMVGCLKENLKIPNTNTKKVTIPDCQYKAITGPFSKKQRKPPQPATSKTW